MNRLLSAPIEEISNKIEAVRKQIDNEWTIERQMLYNVLCDELWETKWQQKTTEFKSFSKVLVSNNDELPSESAIKDKEHDNRDDIEDATWGKRYNELVQYRKQNGNCLVPKLYQQNLELGIWVDTQKTRYNHWKLPIQRVVDLERLGMGWKMHLNTHQDSVWDRKYEELVTFATEHGHCRIPRNYHDGVLSKWVYNQRTQYLNLQDNKSSHMTRYRVGCLEEIGFEWRLRYHDKAKRTGHRFDVMWLIRYKELTEFHSIHGHCNITEDYNLKKLTRWIYVQRRTYRKKNEGFQTNLTDERIQLLNKINFQWIGRGKYFSRSYC